MAIGLTPIGSSYGVDGGQGLLSDPTLIKYLSDARPRVAARHAATHSFPATLHDDDCVTVAFGMSADAAAGVVVPRPEISQAGACPHGAARPGISFRSLDSGN